MIPPPPGYALFSFSFFFIPFVIFALPPRNNSDPGSHSGPPHYGACLHFCREKNSTFSSLVDSHRMVPTHTATRSQHLIFFFRFLFHIFANEVKISHRGGNGTQGPTLEVFEGNHWIDHRGDR